MPGGCEVLAAGGCPECKGWLDTIEALHQRILEAEKLNRAYLSELDDYGKTVTRLRKKVSELEEVIIECIPSYQKESQ